VGVKTKFTRMYCYLHKHGWARVLNSTSNSSNDQGSALVESRGPVRLAIWLAVYAVRHNPLCRADWTTIRIVSFQQTGRFNYRFGFTYKRVSG
jgi:hypothetical protein